MGKIDEQRDARQQQQALEVTRARMEQHRHREAHAGATRHRADQAGIGTIQEEAAHSLSQLQR